MSGPKTSSYELEWRRREEEQRWLDEERYRREQQRQEENERYPVESERRQEEERRRIEALRKQKVEEIQIICTELSAYSEKIRELVQYFTVVKAHTIVSDEEKKELDALLTKVNKALEPYTATSLESAEKKLVSIQKDAQDIRTRFAHFDGMLEQWKLEVLQVLDDETKKLFGMEHKKREKKSVAAPISTAQDREMEQKAAEQEEADSLLEEMRAYEQFDNPALEAEIQRVLKVADNLYRVEDYSGVVSFVKGNKYKIDEMITTIRAQRERENARQQELVSRFEEALLSYEVMCEIAGVTPKQFQREMISESLISYLREERVRIEAEYLALQEKLIVQREMESVMEELGYQIVAAKETMRKNGNVISERIFEYGEGTAIDIIEANGQITMEVVGLDDADRQPSEEEKELLEEEMESFCSLHKEIEDKLRERGVVLKQRLQMNPPAKEYARIINLREYDHDNEVKMINARKKIKAPVIQKKTESKKKTEGVAHP